MRKILLLIAITFLTAACGTPPAPATVLPTFTSVPATEMATQAALATETITLPPEPTFAEGPSPTPDIGSTLGSPIDHLVMVYVPAGPFKMGYEGGYPDEGPEHSVTLSAFWIDKTEIPNGTYEMCVQAGDCNPPAKHNSNGIDNYYGNPQTADYPIIFVAWSDAQNYCDWMGGRLPTEAEWEKAARGTDGRLYPWGDTPPDPTLANFGDNNWDVVATGNYTGAASPYGALDMAGNVWEWVADWYAADYYTQSPANNPTGPESGTKKVMRGGSWNFDTPGLRMSYRLAKDPAYTAPDAGFRCMLPAQ